MARFGFCAGAYRSRSVNADAQACINLYPESIESGTGKSAIALYPGPGLQVFAALTQGSVPCAKERGTFKCTVGSTGERVFAVGDATLFEVLKTGQWVVLGDVGNDTKPVSWAVNNANQLIVCSNGNLFVFPLNGNTGQTRNVGTEVAPIATMQATSLIYQPRAPTEIIVTLDGVVDVPFAVGAYIAYDTLTNAPFLFLNGQSYPINAVGPGISGYYGTPINANQYSFTVPSIGENTGAVSEPSAHATGPGFVLFPSMIQVNVGAGPFRFVDFMDSYFVAQKSDSQEFALSNQEDGTNWDATDVAQIEEYPDNLERILVSDEICWMFGATRTVPYYDSGAPLFPWVPIENVLIGNGIGAPDSAVRLDNTVFWIDQDERGKGIARRMNGYTPTRISTHAIEYAWAQYKTISDAVGYAYQLEGHAFWVLCFPSAQATWQYDVATGLWSQLDREVDGQSLAHPSWNHVFAFGKHLVGDPFSGNIYDMSLNYASYPPSVGTWRWLRRAPHVSLEQRRITYDELQIYIESGDGPDQGTGAPIGYPFISLQDDTGQWYQVSVSDQGILQSKAVSGDYDRSGADGIWTLERSLDHTLWQLGIETGTGRLTATQVESAYQPTEVINFISPARLQFVLFILPSGQLEVSEVPLSNGPEMILRWSKDGGHAYSSEHILGCGKQGDFTYRAIMRRMGIARDMVFELSGTTPVKIIDAYVNTTPPVFQPTERLAHQLAKVQ